MLRLFLSIVAALIATSATADLYPPEALERVRARSVPDIIRVFDIDIVGNLPRDMRVRAANVTLAFPDRHTSPLAFFADPATDTIYMPLESIRFFDDLSTLFAWTQQKQCNIEAVYAYLWAALRLGGDVPPPLEAFGIDRDLALADPGVGRLSDGFFSSGLQFILVHELGHLMLNHQTGLSGKASQRQEEEADNFALDHFSRLGGLPAGILLYYVAASMIDPDSPDALAAATHPASSDRMRAMASRIAADPMAFSSGEIDPEREAALAASIAAGILVYADIVGDGIGVIIPQLLERDWPVSRLPAACPGN